MTDEEIKDKVHTIYNRCAIIMYVLEMPAPHGVVNALTSLFEDNAATIQDILLGVPFFDPSE